MANINGRVQSQNYRIVKLVLALGVVIIAAFILRSIVIYYEVKSSFCTPDDEVYQTIQANVLSWVENSFRPNQSSSRNHIDFSTPNGQKYTAIGIEPDRFFVVTEYDTPHTYMGLKGYIYSPSDIAQFSSEYNFVALGDNLYCYESKL